MKLLLKIEGTKPARMPGADLAKYMLELAALLGAKESVHFVAIRDESTGIETHVGIKGRHTVRQRLRDALIFGNPDARERWTSINGMMARSRTHGALYEIRDGGLRVPRLDFPGMREVPNPLPSARDHIRVQGKLTRLEGKDETIHAGVTGENGDQYSVIVSPDQARMIRSSFQEYVLVEGNATLTRNTSGIWEVGTISATSIEPLRDVPLEETLAELREAGGFGWTDQGASLSDLMQIRRDE